MISVVVIVGAIPSTVIVKDLLSEPHEFTAEIVTGKSPSSVGVPESVPLSERYSPSGRFPEDSDHVRLSPVALIVSL